MTDENILYPICHQQKNAQQCLRRLVLQLLFVHNRHTHFFYIIGLGFFISFVS